VLGGRPDGDLARVSASASELFEKALASGIELVAPNQRRLDELAKAVSEFPPDALREGMKVRDGRAYQTLKDRGMIVKQNFENRFEIAKLSILAAKMEAGERKALLGVVTSGALAQTIKAASLSEDERKRLARILRRCGILCAASEDSIAPAMDAFPEREFRLEMSNRPVWVSEGSKPVLEENLRRIQALNAKIQLKNAERQVKIFSQTEEDDFATLQREYLDLLKQQDDILKDYAEEEKLSAKR